MPIYDLTLHSPLHQGEFVGIERESVLEWVPSDTLWAAIVSTWNALGFDTAARLAGCENGGSTTPFIVTSAFPRAGDLRFYPAPPHLPAHVGLEELGKRAKKIRLLSLGVLQALCAGQTPPCQEENFLHGGNLWLTTQELDRARSLLQEDESGNMVFWRRQTVPHVTIDRTSNASNLFHTGRIVFAKNCGLWFASRGQDEWVSQAINYLSESGLGGLRSTGHGAFTWKQGSDDLPAVDSGWGLCLSRFAPASEDEVRKGLQEPASSYRLITVGGWCQDDQGHPWRRRSIRLVAEGALLPAQLQGKLVDVRPLEPETWLGEQRPVWRNGLALFIQAGKLMEAV